MFVFVPVVVVVVVIALAIAGMREASDCDTESSVFIGERVIDVGEEENLSRWVNTEL